MLKLIIIAILVSIIVSQIYIEEVMDCVDNTCAPVRTSCGIDDDCRTSYNTFINCISEQTEQYYVQCRTNGYIAWVNVMDCYDECNYFSLNSFRIAALIVLILY